ncbi:MAG: hypothetical protein Q8Q37_03135 [bacterium]|nr:hypothetical protein [bacterium]
MKLSSKYKIGLLVLLAVAVAHLILSVIWGLSVSFATLIGHQFFENAHLNTFVYVVILVLILPTFIGVLLFLPNIGDKIYGVLASVPIFSFFAKFIPRSEEDIKRLEDSNFPEIEVEIWPGVWIVGVVTNTFQRDDGEWFRIYVGSCPAIPSGYLLTLEKTKARYRLTGRKLADYSAMIISYGVR